MTLVKFDNGQFGIRTYWFFGWYYISLNNPEHTWKNPACVAKYCMASKPIVLGVLENLMAVKTAKPVST